MSAMELAGLTVTLGAAFAQSWPALLIGGMILLAGQRIRHAKDD